MLRDEIEGYKDNKGYVSPHPTDPKEGRASDNSVMFSSEYYVLLKLRNEDVGTDANEWSNLITQSSVEPGLLVRYPGDVAVGPPDDLYGVAAASKLLDVPEVAQNILSYGWEHYGFYNGKNPGSCYNDGKIDWSAFQWRQLQLVFALLCAAGRYKWYKFYYWPLAIYSALVIATSCGSFMNMIQFFFDNKNNMSTTALLKGCLDIMINNRRVTSSNSDVRRLPWLLIQSVKRDSWLCKLASKVWYSRLYKDYGPSGMKGVSALYYHGNPVHPFTKYFVD